MNMIGCELIRVLGLSDYHLLKANRFWLGHELEKLEVLIKNISVSVINLVN